MRVVDDEGRFVEDELRHARQAAGGVESQGRAGRYAEQDGAPTRLAQESGDVLHLALDGVWQRVPALAAAATIVREDGAVFLQQFRHWPARSRPAITERAIDENHRRPLPCP
jgi:hypothetical protein